MASIITRQLTFKIGSRNILNTIDLHVPDNSIYGYLGRNGAGKSTTIKLLLGLLPDKADSIFIQGRSLKSDPEATYAQVGNLLEAPCYYSGLTVFENLKYLDIIHKKGSKRIDAVLEMVDLYREKNKKAGVLSMGMKQRLGIAMAIYHDPQLLILDEPLNGLDPQGIVEMRDLFRQLKEQGKTIFLSSHILTELEKVATHIGIIENGSMIFQGTKGELLSQVDRQVSLRTTDPLRTAPLLQSLGLTVLSQGQDTLVVQIGDDNQFDLMIKSLVQQCIPICAIESHTADLEQIFMNLITKPNV
ncbi:ATP-binding cassette domain-containing protein [Sphingobacterium thalpophilum]|uniref:ATP-binding cassette domain-containing protein n=1 Tax=Sphingobacterium thalpophilum TaxID=259 RepID=A0A4U9VFQ0_9SPHI|nr:ATP-binding cassette domain-containing protein [Sphingobacterium thalpophilum]VTR44082.1 Daunorubicin/doxorubicin resistance ATP-binding protein DrrA [Sphingobacterium thalpophilum]